MLCLPCKADAPIIEHTIADDGWVEVPLDFTFPFWGNSYTTSFMFANGVVGFFSPNNIPGTGIVNDGLCCSGIDFENASYSSMSSQGYGGVRFDFTIMPWHTDLIDTGPGHFYTQGDSTYQKYMWEAVDEYYQTARENTFDLTIYPLGNIHMTYQELDIANHSVTVAVVGDLSEGEYIQWFYNHPTSGAIYWDTSESAPVDIGEGASICDVVPLSSLVCDYYPEAYAEAYYEEQCTANPLYDTGCVGYYEAYTNQQCSINTLWSSVCSGYETAYFNQQCSLDSLWSISCPNYETAYLDDQCETDPLYSVYCSGYAMAIAEEEIEQELEEEFEEEWEEFLTYELETTIPWDDFEFDTEFTDMPIIEDYDIIDDFSLEPEMDFEITFEEVVQELEIELMEEFEEFEEPPMEEFNEPETEEEIEEEVLEEPEPEEESEPEPEPEPEEEEDSDEIMLAEEEDEEEEPEEEMVAEAEEEESEEEKVAEAETKEPTPEQKKKSKENKMREIITNKLKSLAKEVGEASTLQAQKDLQNYIIALLGYSSGFSTYGSELIDGNFYKDEEIYQNVRLPENQRGLLNGLASEILHEKMVDMQWQN